MARFFIRHSLITILFCACLLVATKVSAQTTEATPRPQVIEFGVNVTVQTQPTLNDHVSALGSLDVSARVAAVRALGELRDPLAIPHIIQTLRTDPNPEVRGWAIRALFQLNTADARAAIAVAARSDADERVRGLAVQLIPEAAPAPTPVIAAPTVAYVAQPPTVVVEQPAPRRQRSPGRGLRTAGWISFGVSYGIMLLQGIIIAPMGEGDIAWPMFVPLIGPTILAARIFADGYDEEQGLGALGIIGSLVQIAGFTMLVVGHVRGRRARLEADANRPSIALIPAAPGSEAGFSLTGRF